MNIQKDIETKIRDAEIEDCLNYMRSIKKLLYRIPSKIVGRVVHATLSMADNFYSFSDYFKLK